MQQPNIITFSAIFFRDQKSPKSPQKFNYSSKVTDGQYFCLEEPPRSPKITYSTPSPTSNHMASVGDIGGNTSPSSGYFEQRSPKYISHQSSSSSTSSSARKFVFDAVSPRHESIGKWVTAWSGTHADFYSQTIFLQIISLQSNKYALTLDWMSLPEAKLFTSYINQWVH